MFDAPSTLVGSALDSAEVADATTVERLRTAIAIRVGGQLRHVVPTLEGMSVVVADMKRCWLALPDRVREHYRALPTREQTDPLAEYVGDYVAVVEANVEVVYPDPQPRPSSAAMITRPFGGAGNSM